MSLQTILVCSFAVAGILTTIAAVITLRHIRAEKARALWGFFLNWAMWAISCFLLVLAHLFYDPVIIAIAYVPQAVEAMVFIIAVDKISRNAVNPIKLTIQGILGALYVFSAWLPDDAEIVPDYGVHVTGWCRIFQILFTIFYMTIFFNWTFSTWRKAPPALKHKARSLPLGALLIYPIPIAMYILATVILPLGAFPFAVHAAGLLIIVLVMVQEPRLFYVLPFTAHHLMVIHRQSGLLLFQHRWSDHNIDPDIYSAVLHALQKIGLDILGAGEMRQIELHEGTLLLSHAKHISVALLASNTSSYLRDCLVAFSNAFDTKLEQLNLPANPVIDQAAFTFGNDLIKTYCKNIPSWISEGGK